MQNNKRLLDFGTSGGKGYGHGRVITRTAIVFFPAVVATFGNAVVVLFCVVICGDKKRKKDEPVPMWAERDGMHVL